MSAGLAALTLLASWFSAGLLALSVACAAAGATFGVAKRLAPFSPLGSLAAALGAATFPLFVLAGGEQGLFRGATAAVLLVSAALLISGPAASPAKSAGVLVWLALLLGFGLSYAVLIRQAQSGARLFLSATLILLAYQASGLVATRTLLAPAKKTAPNMALFSGRLAGLAAAVVGAMASLAFLEEPFGAGPLAVLGVVVALASMLAEAFGQWLQAELPPKRASLPLAGLEAWTLALPAFFYGFRLYLT